MIAKAVDHSHEKKQPLQSSVRKSIAQLTCASSLSNWVLWVGRVQMWLIGWWYVLQKITHHTMHTLFPCCCFLPDTDWPTNLPNYNCQISVSLNDSYMHTISPSTWLFYHIQNGFATFIFVILEVLQAVILIFVWAIHCISLMKNCGMNRIKRRNRVIKKLISR